MSSGLTAHLLWVIIFCW